MKKLKKNENYDHFVIENPYINEIKKFISLVERKKDSKQIYGYADDLKVINLIEAFQIEGGKV